MIVVEVLVGLSDNNFKIGLSNHRRVNSKGHHNLAPAHQRSNFGEYGDEIKAILNGGG